MSFIYLFIFMTRKWQPSLYGRWSPHGHLGGGQRSWPAQCPTPAGIPILSLSLRPSISVISISNDPTPPFSPSASFSLPGLLSLFCYLFPCHIFVCVWLIKTFLISCFSQLINLKVFRVTLILFKCYIEMWFLNDFKFIGKYEFCISLKYLRMR